MAVVVDPALPFEREIAKGVALYARELGDWRLYVEGEQARRLPDVKTWSGHGIIASFDDLPPLIDPGSIIRIAVLSVPPSMVMATLFTVLFDTPTPSERSLPAASTPPTICAGAKFRS